MLETTPIGLSRSSTTMIRWMRASIIRFAKTFTGVFGETLTGSAVIWRRTSLASVSSGPTVCQSVKINWDGRIPRTHSNGTLGASKKSIRSAAQPGLGLTRSSWHGQGPEGDFAGPSFLSWLCFGQQDFADFSFDARLPNPSAKQQHRPGPAAVAKIRYRSRPARIMKHPLSC